MAGRAVISAGMVPLGGTPLLGAKLNSWDCPGGSVPCLARRKRDQNSEAELAFTLTHAHRSIISPLHRVLCSKQRAGCRGST